MTKQNIIIIGHQVLYDILDEFKSYLSFGITNFINENEYYTGSMINKENIKRSIQRFRQSINKVNKYFRIKASKRYCLVRTRFEHNE